MEVVKNSERLSNLMAGEKSADEIGSYKVDETPKTLPTTSASSNSAATMHRCGSRPQLDLSGAAIQGNLEERNPTILLPNQSDDISHLAVDIGGEFSFCGLNPGRGF